MRETPHGTHEVVVGAPGSGFLRVLARFTDRERTNALDFRNGYNLGVSDARREVRGWRKLFS